MQGIQCPRCGWQNESTAIMCGGCGQLLRGAAPTAQMAPPISPDPWTRPDRDVSATHTASAPGAAAADLPTLYAAAPAPPRPAAGWQGAPVQWPGASAAPQRPVAARQRGRGWRVLLTLVLTLAVLACAALGAWGLVIRPPLHARVDGAIAAALDAGAAAIPSIPAQALAYQSSFPVTSADVNAALQQEMSSARANGLDNVSAAFQPGQIVVSYSARGRSGTIDTSLQVEGNRLVATNTTVTGILGWVETGSELQLTINHALDQLQAKTPYGFQSVTIGNGSMTVALRTG